ncbi:MAG: hypothetical protein WC898_02380 [Candidatus Paceibacterota bacterium]|jgi:hypothetical protein
MSDDLIRYKCKTPILHNGKRYETFIQLTETEAAKLIELKKIEVVSKSAASPLICESCADLKEQLQAALEFNEKLKTALDEQSTAVGELIAQRDDLLKKIDVEKVPAKPSKTSGK